MAVFVKFFLSSDEESDNVLFFTGEQKSKPPTSPMNASAWTSELELVDALERGVTEKAVGRSRKQVRVFREFDAGLGRVDLLCVWYDQDRLATRRAACRAADLKPFKLLEGYAMSFLRGSRWVEQHCLQKTLRVSARRTDNLVGLLSQRGLIERRDNMLRARPLSDLWFVERIEAYEAKLDKWKDAAEQASRHLWFASRCYVAMPRLSERVLRQVVETCQQWYLGLCVLRDRETCRVEFPPPRRKAPKTQLGWLVNERIFEEA